MRVSMGTVRQRGREADPQNVRLVLRYRYANGSSTRFAALIDAKCTSTGPGGKRVDLPEYGTVLRFCRGGSTGEETWGPLCNELGVPFALLEKGHVLTESELSNTEF